MGFPVAFGTAVSIASVSLYCQYQFWTTPLDQHSFPDIALPRADLGVPDSVLLGTRACSALVVILTALSALMNNTSTVIVTKHLSKSKFPPVHYDLKGGRRFATFTVQTWCMLGLYFTLATAVSAARLFDLPSETLLASPALAKALWLLFPAATRSRLRQQPVSSSTTTTTTTKTTTTNLLGCQHLPHGRSTIGQQHRQKHPANAYWEVGWRALH